MPAEEAGGPAAAEDSLGAALDRSGQRLTRAPRARQSVELLRNGDAAYPRMLAAIDAATVRIGLSSYIFRDDAAGAPVIEALIRAHRRGVDVRW